MISRYTHDEVKKIWDDANKYKVWLDIELAILKAFEIKKIVPKDTSFYIEKNVKINLDRIYDLELETKHEVVAFVNSILEQIEEHGAYFHYSITSSDIMDTAFSIMLNESSKIIINELDVLLEALKEKALRYKNLICVGRTHGIHAEPMSFGLKFLNWYDELLRHKDRIKKRASASNICIVSGAVGTYSLLDPEIELLTAKILKMNTHNITSQIVSRDVYVDLFSAYALLGSCIERIAVELRHLQRTELDELIEDFGIKQAGSSAMPHKRNPISAENLSGCARMLRGYASMTFENQALWHERDISHSSVERVVGSDASILLAYSLKRLSNLISKISIKEDKVRKNLNLSRGLVYSSFVLKALMQKGLVREKAYKLVQDCSKKIWYDENVFFIDVLKSNNEVLKYLSINEIENIFNSFNFENTDLIYKRILN
jgi:adenylosuccinate lyase